jgi:hypothetical protein
VQYSLFKLRIYKKDLTFKAIFWQEGGADGTKGGRGTEISGLVLRKFLSSEPNKTRAKKCGLLVLNKSSLVRVLVRDDDTTEGLTDHDNSCDDLFKSQPTATYFRDTLPLSSGLIKINGSCST